MFDSDLERFIGGAVGLLIIIIAWAHNSIIDRMQEKADKVMDELSALRQYLYERDPQFDDERQLLEDLESGSSFFAGASHMDLIKQKRAAGRRTLLDGSFDPGD